MLGLQEVILILAILLLVFGPTELPKMARELGKAWHEFNKASSGVVESLGTAVANTATTTATTAKKEDEMKLLLEAARKFQVITDGKTSEQLTQEILAKLLNKEEIPSKKVEAP